MRESCDVFNTFVYNQKNYIFSFYFISKMMRENNKKMSNAQTPKG